MQECIKVARIVAGMGHLYKRCNHYHHSQSSRKQLPWIKLSHTFPTSVGKRTLTSQSSLSVPNNIPHPSMSVDTVTDKCLSQAHPLTNTSHLTDLISCYHKEPAHLATCTRTVGESTPALNTDSSTTYNYQSSAQGNAEIALRCTLNRKRTERSSPIPSPQKLTQSPARKQRKRPPPRTGTEQSIHTPLAESQSVSNYHFINTCSEEIPADKTLSDFLPNEKESTALNELQEQIHCIHVTKSCL